MGRIIAIASQKGGVGKTTTAINLGVSLSIFQKKVLVVDLDPQGSVAETFQLNEFNINHGLAEVFLKKVPLSDAIKDIGLDNFEIVSNNTRSQDAELELYAAAYKKNILKQVLEPYISYYDFILIDCPPNLGSLTLNAMIAASSILIPVQCEYYSARSLGKFLRSIRDVSGNQNNNLTIEGILITLFDKRLKKSVEIADNIKKTFKNLVFNTVIPRNSKISEAPSFGKPVALHDINSKGAIAYLNLAEEILIK